MIESFISSLFYQILVKFVEKNCRKKLISLYNKNK